MDAAASTSLGFLLRLHLYQALSVEALELFYSLCQFLIPLGFCRTVNGLLKTALGPPPGSVTSLSPVQDMTFRHESVKCLVRIIKSMGSWMDQQLKVGEHNPPKSSDNENVAESPSYPIDDATNVDYELHPEANSEISDAATLEQRRTHKKEIQVCLLFLF